MRQPNEKEAGVGAGHVPPHVGKIEVLGNQKASSSLRGSPHLQVGATGEMFRANGIEIVTKSGEDRDETGLADSRRA